jgi:hypothetical protein
MADAIPTPPDSQPKTQSTVVVQPPMSQWEALKAAGWWTPFDWALLILIALIWVSGFYWTLFGEPGLLGAILLLLLSLSLKSVWLISLVFRCSWFVLRVNADIATMPQESARIAVAFLAGQAPPTKK